MRVCVCVCVCVSFLSLLRLHFLFRNKKRKYVCVFVCPTFVKKERKKKKEKEEYTDTHWVCSPFFLSFSGSEFAFFAQLSRIHHDDVSRGDIFVRKLKWSFTLHESIYSHTTTTTTTHIIPRAPRYAGAKNRFYDTVAMQDVLV